MGRGSPIYDKLQTEMVAQFEKNVPKCTVAKTLKIPPSTVHNNIKRFKESSVCA